MLLLHMILGENHRENPGADLFVHFVGGGLAGITAASATYPLDLVRTRLGAQRRVIYYRGIGHAFSTIRRDEGFLGLYKGLGATLLGVGPSIAISFSVYETFVLYGSHKGQKIPWSWSVLLVAVFEALCHQQQLFLWIL